MKRLTWIPGILCFVLVLSAPAEAAQKNVSPAARFQGILQAELTRLEGYKSSEGGSAVDPAVVALEKGTQLMTLVQGLIAKRNTLNTPELRTALYAYYYAKLAVHMNFAKELDQLNAWLGARDDAAARYFKSLVKTLERGKQLQAEGGSASARSLASAVVARYQAAMPYFDQGTFEGTAPDTHRGDALLIHMYVSGQLNQTGSGSSSGSSRYGGYRSGWEGSGYGCCGGGMGRSSGYTGNGMGGTKGKYYLKPKVKYDKWK